MITRKRDHKIIDTGPYAFVRHPIYCGLIIALLATAIAEEDWERCLAACSSSLVGLRFLTADQETLRDGPMVASRRGGRRA